MLGFIGGSGLYKMDGLTDLDERIIKTPLGDPSGPVSLGKINGTAIAFLPRHGKEHSLLPSEVNFAANIWALKSLGVTQIVAISAVGSLEKETSPGDVVLVGQYFDWTRGRRRSSFFGEGIVGLVSTAEPICNSLANQVSQLGSKVVPQMPRGKTYGCIEGPRFGTRTESHFLRMVGCHLVGMTNVPEAFLAREAQICYCAIAVVTDYDCWMEDASQHVSTQKMLEIYGQNLRKVTQVLQNVAATLPQDRDCTCRHSLAGAVMTPKEMLSVHKREMLDVLLK